MRFVLGSLLGLVLALCGAGQADAHSGGFVSRTFFSGGYNTVRSFNNYGGYGSAFSIYQPFIPTQTVIVQQPIYQAAPVIVQQPVYSQPVQVLQQPIYQQPAQIIQQAPVQVLQQPSYAPVQTYAQPVQLLQQSAYSSYAPIGVGSYGGYGTVQSVGNYGGGYGSRGNAVVVVRSRGHH